MPTFTLVDGVQVRLPFSLLGFTAAAQGARRRSPLDLAAVKLEAVVHDLVAEACGDLLLQRLDARAGELDDLAGVEVDQVVVVGAGASSKRAGPPAKAWRWIAPLSSSARMVR